MLNKFIGLVLIVDGILSMWLVWDKRNIWQIGRMIRIGIGVILIVT
jgi:hypothetical protein